MFWERISIGSQERVLVAKNSQVKTVLTPGKHNIFVPPFVSLELERHNVNDLVLESKWSRYLLTRAPAIADRHFIRVGTDEVQVGLVYANGQLFKVLTPYSRILIWRDVAEIRVELVDVVGCASVDDEKLEKDDLWSSLGKRDSVFI